MRYRSSQDIHSISQKAHKRLKKQRLKFWLALLWQTLLIVIMLGLPAMLLWSWGLLPPHVAIVPLVLDAVHQVPDYITHWFGQFNAWRLGLFGGVCLVLSFLFVHFRTLSGYGYWLKMMSAKQSRDVQALDTITNQPLRHFVVGWSKNLLALLCMGVWAAAALFIGVYSYAWMLTILRTGMNTIMHIAFLVGIGIIFIGSLALIAWGLIWLYLGLKWLTLPLSDAPEMTVHHSYAISWRLMKDNRRLLVKLKLRRYLPVGLTALVIGIIFFFIDMQTVPYANLISWSIVIILLLWAWHTWGMSQLTEVLLYREQTEQYACRLNDQYPDFHAQPKPGMAQRYRTDKHPNFSPKAVRVSLPNDATVDDTPSKPAYQPSHRHQMTREEVLATKRRQDSMPDPGYRLNQDQVKKPVAARDIFDKKAYTKNEENRKGS